MRRCLLLLLALGGTAGAELRVDGHTVRALSGEQVTWQWTFAPELGAVSRPVRLDGQNYVAVGPVVYALSDEGRFLGRADLPGRVTSLDSSGGAVRVSVGGPGGSERLTLGAPSGDTLPVEERVVFAPDPAVTGWLARFADALPEGDVTRAGAQFPANPFIALREAEAATARGDDYAALSAVRRALAVTLPFPAWTQLAARLDRAGFPAAANLALDRAKRDAAARGIDPAVPVSRAALFAYGNPSGYVDTLLTQNRLPRAEIWMSFLRELYPRFEGGDALYHRYADVLEAQGRAGEAEEWRQFARSLRAGTLYNLGPNDTGALRDVARLATFALMTALLAAVLTLSARAWPTQRQDLAALGGRWRSWRRPPERLRRTALAYASFSERLLLLTLAAGLLTALGGWQWANLTGRALRDPALGTGTYSASPLLNHPAINQPGLNSPAPGAAGGADLQPVAASYLLAGLRTQLDGDLAAARTLYGRAGTDACALNNLGAIAQSRDDLPQARSLYQRALSLQPDLSAAAYNLGRNPGTPETTFQRTYRPGQPRLCYPERRALARSVSGDLGSVLRGAVTDPLGFLAGRRAHTRLSWGLLAALPLLGVLLVLLLIPRAADRRRLGRPAAFRAFATLLPGAGLLGNAWGGVLLVAWAGVAVALLARWLPFPTLPLQAAPVRSVLWLALGALYALNVLALLLIEAAHARRRRQGELEG
ncbi:hypothetical protein [Deinococcus wulumuqiensis]|uniref:Tetratricopeptide repeat protein n=1 Tax=Deinococcus wulumuqiensis TaxID=980427 RepID=A0AAV4KA43_9DEIO|nr:hypothetical protein [Deinococcus wulumuqiensis]QII21618.1 hypothetical protein G6R31_13505 [Deinococcus wulumuqiensis R12]GGI90267.1 hypothetical protein GCM10010914_25860 [Deinococcus wulumuqiensis]GGP30747.1 hypothetical protein GCM10008021_23980 [Deinococcus wulumuqiensis]